MGVGLTGTGARASAGLAGTGARAGSGLLLPRAFLARPAPEVAPDLLGCVLTRESAAGLVAAEIVEVEAYAGESDPASHAFRGRTARNAVMFGPPGHAYVYFTYGMHFCVNLVCQPDGTASAVLLRAGRVIAGAELAAARRSGPARVPSGGPRAVRTIDLARGPARLCQALGIDRALDGADVCDPASPLRVLAPAGPAARNGSLASAGPGISCGPRVGVSRAAEVAWRFWTTGEPAVSPYRPGLPRRRRAKPVPGPARDDGTMHR